MSIRRAAVFTLAERYATIVLSFTQIAVLSRILTPQEIGVSVLGLVIVTVVEQLRDMPTSYIIMEKDLSRDSCRTCFTGMLLVTIVSISILFLAAPTIAGAYDDSGLVLFINVILVALTAGPIERPLIALMRRELAFGHVGFVIVTSLIAGIATAIATALMGWGYMSFAWGVLVGNWSAALMAVIVRPDTWVFWPSLSNWRAVMAFSGLSTIACLLDRAFDYLPYIVLSRTSGLDAVGNYNRAIVVSEIPYKLLILGFTPLVMPAFAAEVRAGRGLAAPYLTSITLLSAIHWPAFLLLALLAYPATLVLLGPQWGGIAVIVQIIAVARMFSISNLSAGAAFTALGAMRKLVRARLVSVLPCAAIVGIAAYYGPIALASSLLIALLLDAINMNFHLKKLIGFRWVDLLNAGAKSAVTTVFSAIGPVGVMSYAGTFDVSVATAILAGVLAIPGWILGLVVSKHPLIGEFTIALRAAQRLPFVQHFR